MISKHFFRTILLAVSSALATACNPSNQAKQQGMAKETEMVALADQNFKDAAAQYKFQMTKLPPDHFAKTYYEERDQLRIRGTSDWCSGFYPGTLLNLYEETKDQALLDEALRYLHELEKEQFNTSTHDLGFMMYCSFGNAQRINPNPAYRQVLINSAKSLSSRFNPSVGCIRSWNSEPEDFLVIIDNMMNLELLFWATRATGDSSFYNIARTHANTTMQNHFRPDNSSYHVINYNPTTGAVQEKKTAQGAGNESAWARGQIWGLYGFTMMYRETKDEKYLRQAQRISDFILHHPNLPEDKIPYWDFDAPEIPDEERDASAAAIMASALLELSHYADSAASKDYFNTAETILRNLSSESYKAEPRTNGGFILKHGVGHKPGNTEIDVPLTYADYYFVEALKRYKHYKAPQQKKARNRST